MPDIYFEENYGQLYENTENGVCEVFLFQHEFGSIRHMFIKREIPYLVNNEKYYDLITPYGYGGPLVLQFVEGKKNELVSAFFDAFQIHCKQNKIVSEFIRFHPLMKNAHDFKDCYQIQFIRDTVGTNLHEYEDPVASEYSKSKRKSIKKSLEKGTKFRIIERPDTLEAFKELYYHTMDRNSASAFYYFEESYFTKLLETLGQHLILVEVIYENTVIGMGLNFVYGKTIHIHLSGSLTEFAHLCPSFVLRYAMAVWGKENGYHLIHEGGGRTNSPADALFQLKKQFGKNTRFQFHTASQIWDEEIYHQLCGSADLTENGNFFPAYRGKIAVESNMHE